MAQKAEEKAKKVAEGGQEEAKGEEDEEDEEEQINTATPAPEEKGPKEDLIYDMDSGEMLTKEEYNKRQNIRDL